MEGATKGTSFLDSKRESERHFVKEHGTCVVNTDLSYETIGELSARLDMSLGEERLENKKPMHHSLAGQER